MKRGEGTRLFAIFLLLGTGCASMKPSLSIPKTSDFLVAVKDAGLPNSEPWLTRFAKHTWFDIKAGPESPWIRVEILNEHSGVLVTPIPSESVWDDFRWDRRAVRILRLFEGEKAREIAEAILSHTALRESSRYRAWPGPNSNTFAEKLLRTIPGFGARLHHNAVGKDWTALFFAGASSTGSGLRLDTPVLGMQIGLEDGLQLHFLQLSLGLSFWPPAVEIPFLPRIGF